MSRLEKVVGHIYDEASQSLLERIKSFNKKPDIVVDLSANAEDMQMLYKDLSWPNVEYVHLDVAHDLYQKLDDSTSLYKRSEANKADIILSNMTLHWSDVSSTVTTLKKHLKPDGVLMFSMLGANAFWELHSAFEAIGFDKSMHHFDEIMDIERMMQKAHFTDVVFDHTEVVFSYEHVEEVFADLKSLGVSTPDQSLRWMTPRQYDRLVKAYEGHCLEDGRFPVTVQLIYGCAYGYKDPQLQTQQRVPISSIKKMERLS